MKQDLKALQKKWDKILAKKGFVDIESRESGMLKSWSGSPLTGSSSVGDGSTVWKVIEEQQSHYSSRSDLSSLVHKESQAEYYRLAAQKLHTEKFPDREARKAWTLHCEGLSQSAVALRMGLKRRRVQYILDTLSSKFGLGR